MTQQGSLENKLVALIGGSGFVGTYLAQELLQAGARLRIADLNPGKAGKLKPLANLGQFQAVACDVTNKRSVAAAVAGADAVVYLVGGFGENQEALQADGAGDAAEAAAAAGVSSFVYLSALGAKADSANSYLATKAKGERRVLNAFPNATILRSAILFGEDDSFVNAIATGIEAQKYIPLVGGDKQIQPVLVDDVATAIFAALASPAIYGGNSYDLVGPEIVTVRQLHERIAALQEREPKLIDVPNGFAALVAALPLSTLSANQWQQIKDSGIADGTHAGLEQFGIAPRPLNLFLDRWMVRFRRNGRFATLNKMAL